MSDVGRELAELLDRKNADGSPLHSDEEVREVIPLLASGIVRAFPEASFPHFVVEAIGEVSLKAGVDEQTPAAEIWPALERYYRDHPNPLATALESLLRQAATVGRLEGARAMASMLGVETSNQPLGGARPEGTVPAGPAARFAALKQTPKK